MLIPGRGFLHGNIGIISHAQILTLPTTVITAVLGIPDRILIPVSAELISTIAIAYTNINAAQSALGFYWGSTGATSSILNESTDAITDLDTFLGSFGAGTFFGTLIKSGAFSANYGTLVSAVNDISSTKGISLTIKIDNVAAGNLTGGNANNNIRYSILYLIFNTLTGQYE